MPLELRLEAFPPAQQRAARAVLKLVGRKPTIAIEAVDVGVFVKRERTIIELRPKTKWLSMSIVTNAPIDDPRITRTYELSRGYCYFLRLHDAQDVDDTVRGWIRAALQA